MNLWYGGRYYDFSKKFHQIKFFLGASWILNKSTKQTPAWIGLMTIKRFRNFAKHGVSVILDLHQVVWFMVQYYVWNFCIISVGFYKGCCCKQVWHVWRIPTLAFKQTQVNEFQSNMVNICIWNCFSKSSDYFTIYASVHSFSDPQSNVPSHGLSNQLSLGFLATSLWKSTPSTRLTKLVTSQRFLLPQALYENKQGVADSLAKAWATVARELGMIEILFSFISRV